MSSKPEGRPEEYTGSRPRLEALLLAAILAPSLAGGLVSAADPNTLTSVKVSQVPVSDGRVDALWNNAPGITVEVSGGASLPQS